MAALKTLGFCGFFLFGALASAIAQTGQGSSSYPASFFADFRPNTANDMVARLPGFTLDTGTVGARLCRHRRQYSGRWQPPHRQDRRRQQHPDAHSRRQRRPYRSDPRRRARHRHAGPERGRQYRAARPMPAPDHPDRRNTCIEDGEWVPNGGIEYHGQSGDLRYEASLARTANNWDDSPGYGYRAFSPPAGRRRRRSMWRKLRHHAAGLGRRMAD